MEIVKVKIGDRGAELTAYIQQPSREMANTAVKPAMLVLPGGAYLFCSDREAEPIALAYAAEGFQTFVLRYSVGKKAVGCQPLKEAAEAIALIRERAKEWHLHPEQIAVCGFSAGGHLAAWVGLKGDHKPNAVIMGYGATDLDGHRAGKSPLLASLFGDDYTDEDINSVELTQYVTKNSPPLFSWTTAEDAIIDVRKVLGMADAYAAAGCPQELHVFQKGEHGLSLAKPITAYGRLAMADAHAAAWHPMSVEWLWRQFDRPTVEDKPYEPIPGLIPDME